MYCTKCAIYSTVALTHAWQIITEDEFIKKMKENKAAEYLKALEVEKLRTPNNTAYKRWSCHRG